MSSEAAVPRQVSIRIPKVTPLTTYSLLGITIGIYLLQVATQSIVGIDLPALYGMKVNELIIQGQFWRLITPVFLHGSILHLGFNMYALFILGPMLERHYGHGRFLALYLLAGFAGNVVSFLFSPVPSLGASTAIFGLLGAQGVLFYQNRELFGHIARSALINIIVIAAINLIIGLSPMIDNWGHVGGLVGGTLFAWFGGPILHVEGIHPDLYTADARSARHVWLAGIGDFALFAALAAINIVLQIG